MPLTASSSSPEVGGAIVQAGVRSRAAAVPTWLLVGGLFALSFVYRFVYAMRDPAPWIFHDELVYSELAKSFGETGHFAMRGVPGTGGFAVLYPVLISPAYALFDRIPDAYDGVRAINCVLMSATVVPVYLIARRLAPRIHHTVEILFIGLRRFRLPLVELDDTRDRLEPIERPRHRLRPDAGGKRLLPPDTSSSSAMTRLVSLAP